MLKVRVSDDEFTVLAVRVGLENNDGYCPCKVSKTPETKCMCKEFRDQTTPGLCHCGLYEKYDDAENPNED